MSEETKPRTIGPYQVVALLGRRHPATLYQATGPDGQPVVVELFSRALSEPAAVERFQREVHEIAGLEHTHLLRLYASGEAEGQVYLVREPWGGRALSEILAERRPALPEAISVFKGILRGLGQLHQRGLLHRDLNPSTVLTTDDFSQVKLAGFGLGRADALGGTTGTLSTGEVSLSNIYYLSPEQAEGRPGDARSDLYSAGVLFHQLLTGRAPSAKFGLPSQLNPELPPEVDTLVLKCLARRPEERYSNVPHLSADLARLEEILRLRLHSQLQGISRSTSRLLGQGEGGRRRSPGLLWGGIALAVAITAVVIFLLVR